MCASGRLAVLHVRTPTTQACTGQGLLSGRPQAELARAPRHNGSWLTRFLRPHTRLFMCMHASSIFVHPHTHSKHHPRRCCPALHLAYTISPA
jgi:hypothetical protein